MADKTSAATIGYAPAVSFVTTAGTIATESASIIFDEDSTAVEVAAAIERAKIQVLDFMADKA